MLCTLSHLYDRHFGKSKTHFILSLYKLQSIRQITIPKSNVNLNILESTVWEQEDMKKLLGAIILLSCLVLSSPLQASDRSANHFNEAGFKFQQAGHYSEAIAQYKKALEANPQHFAANNNLGTIYYISGDYKKAEKYYKVGVRQNPKSYAARYSLGMALLSQVEKVPLTNDEPIGFTFKATYEIKVTYDALLNEAVEELKLAVKYNPNSYQARTALGIAYLKLSRFEEAASELKKALALNPKYPMANYFMGFLMKQYDRRDSIAFFKRTIKEDKYFTKAYVHLCKELIRQQQYQEALYFSMEGLKVLNSRKKQVIIKNRICLQVQKNESQISYKKLGTDKYKNNVYMSYASPLNENDRNELTKIQLLISYL